MKNFLLIALTIFTSASLLAGDGSIARKDFEIQNYACYTDSIGALNGAVDMILHDAQKWCDGLNGELSRIHSNDLEVVVHSESPFPGGCRGDVTVKSTFSCFVNGKITIIE
ncbi:hypothetical protein ACRXCV_05450 [Halobacteriovorax sp. GFR7]|uniref:hypothetical protein n=1 Tax=unclassified Halobacteriovorax TaxID=2639665 RepID=UPI003D973A41